MRHFKPMETAVQFSMMKSVVYVASLLLLMSACGDDEQTPSTNTNTNTNTNNSNTDDGNLVDLVAQTTELSSMLTVITYIDANGSQADANDLATLLAGVGPFTVFAPNNAALAAALDRDDDGDFDADDVTALEATLGGATATSNALYLVVANHAVNGQRSSTALSNGQELDTLAGTYDATGFGILVDTSSGVVVSGSFGATPATVVGPDIAASNGIAHIIDQVILDEATSSALGLGETPGGTQMISANVFLVPGGVTFDIGNQGAANFLFSWSDAGGTFEAVADPTLRLIAGETYTFRRTTGSHPFHITTDALVVTGTDGSFSRTTTSGPDIDDATLTPIADFTADPAPTSDAITWTPNSGEVGDYFYTCRITGHQGMTGAIEVQDGT